MSRRKQLKPQQIQINDFSLNRHAEDACLCCAHVCRRCCAEFSLLSDLEQHQTVCSPEAPVLLVSEDEDLLSVSKSLPAASAGELGETVLNFEVENSDSPSRERSYKHADVMNYRRSNHRRAESSGNICSNQNISGTDAVLYTSVYPESVPHSDGYLWRRDKVFVENLESTKVALAQFSQLVDSDSRHSKTSTSSLLQQLLGLQIQQMQQLQLTDHIRHQVLLFASHLAEIPDALLVCTKDLPSPDPFSQLRALSAHLSQELAAASGTATFLSAQSADTSDLKHFTPTEQLNQSRRNGKQHTDCGAAHSELHLLSQTKTSSLMFGNNSSPNIGAIVKDLGALAASARQRKRENLKLFTPNTSSAECLCKHRCRFCSKVFGKDSALQIHLRSHTGERQYRCSICGSRFSTRGNLKVHFERHRETPPAIKKHLYHVPEHNIQSSAVSLSLSPGTAAARPSDGSLSSMSPDNTSPVVKKEDDWMSVPTKTSGSAQTNQQRAMNLKSDGDKASFNVSKMVDLFTHPTSTWFSGLLSLRCSDELQLLSDAADKGASDLNECVLCPRAFSCQSDLTHHRTDSGGRPYQSHLCGRAFTTKGDPNTQQTVQRATVPLRVQRSCQSEFTGAAVLQRHEGQRSNADCARQKHSACRRKEEYDNKGAFCDNQLSTFKSLCIHLSPLHTNRTGADKRTRYDGPHGELQRVKSESSEGSNEGRRQTNKQPAAEKGHSLAPEQFLSPRGQTSVSSKTNLNKAFETWFDSTALKLRRSASEPTEQKPFNAPSVGHSLREKWVLKNNYCEICGKKFACQSALEIHYRSHTKERPFICTTCNRGFSTKGNLKQHTLTHQMRDFPSHLFKPSAANEALDHGSSTLSSDTNSSAFGSRKLLPGRSQSSTVSHRTPRQRLCRTCGKSFSSSSALQIHQRTHTGERPFACAVCGRAFTTKGNLKVHMGTHMWNGAPCRRGCRLSVDRSAPGIRTRPVKLPEKNPDVVSNSRVSVYCRKESPEVFSAGLRINDVASPRQDT